MELPLPVAALALRARNAKSPKERHDTACFAWEVSVKLAVAAHPPADPGPLARGSLGQWVAALSLAPESLSGKAILDLHSLLTEVGSGRKATPRSVSPARLLDALPAYRNQTIGHGSARTASYYDGACEVLLAGLEAAWKARVFFPWDGSELVHVESVEEGPREGRFQGRVLRLMGLAPMVVTPGRPTPLPKGVHARRLYVRTARGLRPLFPWVLHEEGEYRERILFFNGLVHGVRYLDYLSGESLRGKGLLEGFPEADARIRELFRSQARDLESTGPERSDPDLFGDYRILGKLGEGGMGVVYLGQQESLGRAVAIKMLPAGAADDPVARARFHREVGALSRCDHPNVVKIVASGEARGIPYYAMEYIEGADLTLVARALSDTGDFQAAVSTASERLRESRRELFEGVPDLRGRPPVEERPRPAGGAAAGGGSLRYRDVARVFRDAALGLQHLHDSGVLHRDVKPANLMVTSAEHRMVVMDLGLAAVGDASRSITRDKGAILGTLRYMPPEQLQRNLIQLDRRADVYSLGATLYELLADRPFLDGDSEARLIEQVLHERPPAPSRVDGRIPRDLSAIVEKATDKDRRLRYDSAQAMADDLEAYLEHRPIAARPPSLWYVVKLAVARNRALAATIAAALLVVVLGTAVAFGVVNGARRRAVAARKEAETQRTRADAKSAEAEAARKEAETSRNAEAAARKEAQGNLKLAQARLLDFERMADVKRLQDLEREAEEALGPAWPEKVPAMEAWLERAQALAGRVGKHAEALGRLSKLGPPFERVEDRWMYDTLSDLVAGIYRFRDPGGTLASVRERLARARSVEEETIGKHRAEWEAAIASIRDPEQCPQYHGLVLEPQLGLIPIGRDPDSGLWEFALWGPTGELPSRGKDGKLVLTEETGLVFVLIPGGKFLMGSPEDEEGRDSDEGPQHEVALDPFFISKYEMTQGQWKRFTGENPSYYGPANYPPDTWWDRLPKGHKRVLLHPVEQVSWQDCTRVLGHLGLVLPTEAQWEYAARAGTTTPWWTGAQKESLRGAANLSDAYGKSHGNTSWTSYEPWLDDGFSTHAPVGSFRPNGFGLHDVAGNVWEWCRDVYGSYDLPVSPGDGERRVTPSGSSASAGAAARFRVFRGGSYYDPAADARSAPRDRNDPGIRFLNLGVRPARPARPRHD